MIRPPDDTNDEYTKYINASQNTEVESMLDTPAEKKCTIRKEVFMKGRQESLEDVITLTANLKVLGNFDSRRVKVVTINNLSSSR